MTAAAIPTRRWTSSELAAFDSSPLIHIIAPTTAGTTHRPVPIGHVRLGRDELIRSLLGAEGAWYRRALRAERGEIEVKGRRIGVAFFRESGREEEVDRALRARYGDDSGVRRMTSPPARKATLRVEPLA